MHSAIRLLLGVSTLCILLSSVLGSAQNLDEYIETAEGENLLLSGENLQFAIDSCSKGGTVKIVGSIEISTDIVLKSDITIRGGELIRAPETYVGGMVLLNNVHNVRITGIIFDGNMENNVDTPYSKPKGSGGQNCIKIGWQGECSNIRIDNCTFQSGIASHIFAFQTSHHVTVEDCTFYGRRHEGWGAAVWFRSHHGVIRNNHIQDTYACGIVMEGTEDNPADNNTVDGNYITGEIAHGIHSEGLSLIHI